MELMETFAEQKNIPVLVNIHDVNLAKRYAKRIIGMCNGKVHYDGSPEGISEEDFQNSMKWLERRAQGAHLQYQTWYFYYMIRWKSLGSTVIVSLKTIEFNI